ALSTRRNAPHVAPHGCYSQLPLRFFPRRQHKMEYRKLGTSHLLVSPLTLGTMMFGGATDEAESLRIIQDAREHGINSMDTADIYNKGETERVVAKALAQGRDYWVLASKVGNPM